MKISRLKSVAVIAVLLGCAHDTGGILPYFPWKDLLGLGGWGLWGVAPVTYVPVYPDYSKYKFLSVLLFLKLLAVNKAFLLAAPTIAIGSFVAGAGSGLLAMKLTTATLLFKTGELHQKFHNHGHGNHSTSTFDKIKDFIPASLLKLFHFSHFAPKRPPGPMRVVHHHHGHAHGAQEFHRPAFEYNRVKSPKGWKNPHYYVKTPVVHAHAHAQQGGWEEGPMGYKDYKTESIIPMNKGKGHAHKHKHTKFKSAGGTKIQPNVPVRNYGSANAGFRHKGFQPNFHSEINEYIPGLAPGFQIRNSEEFGGHFGKFEPNIYSEINEPIAGHGGGPYSNPGFGEGWHNQYGWNSELGNGWNSDLGNSHFGPASQEDFLNGWDYAEQSRVAEESTQILNSAPNENSGIFKNVNDPTEVKEIEEYLENNLARLKSTDPKEALKLINALKEAYSATINDLEDIPEFIPFPSLSKDSDSKNKPEVKPNANNINAESRSSTGHHFHSADGVAMTNPDLISAIRGIPEEIKSYFNMLSTFDTGNCFERLICDINSNFNGRVENMSQYERNVLMAFRLLVPLSASGAIVDSVSQKYLNAAQFGGEYMSLDACHRKYPACQYSSKQLISMGDKLVGSAGSSTEMPLV